jgi:hypothetical protein
MDGCNKRHRDGSRLFYELLWNGTYFNRGKPNDEVVINQTGTGTCGA